MHTINVKHCSISVAMAGDQGANALQGPSPGIRNLSCHICGGCLCEQGSPIVALYSLFRLCYEKCFKWMTLKTKPKQESWHYVHWQRIICPAACRTHNYVFLRFWLHSLQQIPVNLKNKESWTNDFWGIFLCLEDWFFFFFPSLSPMEQKAMWIPFVYFFVSAPDCLLADMCVALCGLVLVSDYYKVRRKSNNQQSFYPLKSKALVLRG